MGREKDMKVLVIGKGGREHAICWKFAQSPNVTEVIAAPGSDGMRSVARCVPIEEHEADDLLTFSAEENIGLVVIGPEAPLVNGLADRFTEAGIRVFGPSQKAAQVEGSKEFAKTLMKKHAIPTGDYAVFTELDRAKDYVRKHGAPIVIKADGLAAGKGVVVAMTETEAFKALEDMLDSKQFGEAGARVVIEEYVAGEECSLMAFVHGETVVPMVVAQDHKRAFEGDRGPNTGGMGAYSPVPHLNEKTIAEAEEQILRRMAKAMSEEGCPFTGILYAGLMITEKGPKVIEFNARFGDPETQVVLPRLKTPLDDVIVSVLNGEEKEILWAEEACLGVVLASEGYPDGYEKGQVLDSNLLKSEEGQLFFHAGTKNTEAGWVTNGGRVGIVTSLANTLEQAKSAAYNDLARVKLDGLFYRSDIGNRAISPVTAGASSISKTK